MLHTQMTGFSTLEGHAWLSLTTFGRDGQPAAAPIRFALVGDTVYTPASPDLAQRIHDNAQVEVAPCTETGALRGAAMEAMAVVVRPDSEPIARSALAQKYGLLQRLRDLVPAPRVYLEITPM